jgi:internalin A
MMCRWISVVLLCLMIATPYHAQDDTPTPYEIALQRIEEAHKSGATDLNLSGLGLIELPPEIGYLSDLRYLYLHDNQLTSLPSEIGQLSNLRSLDVSFNQLTVLPPAIWQLSNLWMLILDVNEITTLPSEIGQLGNLRLLTLNNNQLTVLPPEIAQLGNLQTLSLYNNQLTVLPPEIAQLKNLQQLSLGSNQLTSLPPEIGQLSNLCLLYLADNKLQHLPTTIGNLTLLAQEDDCFAVFNSGLYLDNNPLISPPPEVVEQGTAAVLNYLRNQAWYHIQRLIIGAAGGVGLFALLVLGFRWKQRDGRKLKQKR